MNGKYLFVMKYHTVSLKIKFQNVFIVMECTMFSYYLELFQSARYIYAREGGGGGWQRVLKDPHVFIFDKIIV